MISILTGEYRLDDINGETERSAWVRNLDWLLSVSPLMWPHNHGITMNKLLGRMDCVLCINHYVKSCTQILLYGQYIDILWMRWQPCMTWLLFDVYYPCEARANLLLSKGWKAWGLTVPGNNHVTITVLLYTDAPAVNTNELHINRSGIFAYSSTVTNL